MTDYWQRARGEKVTPKEKNHLYNLAFTVAENFENPNIVNIGVSWGASVHCLVAGAPEANHYAIDVDFDTRPVQGIEYLSTVKFIQAKSGRYDFGKKPAHLVFVDGDHSYEGVKADINNWAHRIPVGGIICFHDYKPASQDEARLKGVIRAVNEWYKANIDNWTSLGVVGSIVTFRRVG